MRMRPVYPCEAYANHVCHVRYYRSYLHPGAAGTGLTSIRVCYTRYHSVSDRAELLQAMHQYMIVTGTSTVTCSRAALVQALDLHVCPVSSRGRLFLCRAGTSSMAILAHVT